jgi:hypothetical protein
MPVPVGNKFFRKANSLSLTEISSEYKILKFTEDASFPVLVYLDETWSEAPS